MSIDQLHHHLSAAADDRDAPATRVTAAVAYRAGLRRRTRLRWSAGGALVTALALAAGVPALALGTESPGGQYIAGGRDFTPADPSCPTVAATVRDAAASALPDRIRWGQPRLPEGASDLRCDTGGLFWLPFEYRGRDGELGFEGGTGTQRGCDPQRHPVKCQHIDGGEIGHLNGSGEYGVLYGANGAYFFLGLTPGNGRPALTTNQLAGAAQAVATVFS